MSTPRAERVAGQPTTPRAAEPEVAALPSPTADSTGSSPAPAARDGLESAAPTGGTGVVGTISSPPLKEPSGSSWHTLVIGNPFADSRVHASHYAALPAASAWAMDRLTEKYPDIDRHWAARFLELAVNIGWQVPWMVYSHEAGHARAAERFGWDWEIEMTGWMSGLTRYDLKDGAPYTLSRELQASAAGVTQEQINAMAMYRDWALNGGTRYQEAISFLLAQTNLAAYAVNSLRKEGKSSSSDDIGNYIDGMKQSGVDLSMGQLTAVALAADLCSASFWAAAIGSLRFVATGERSIKVPAIALGRTLLTLPNFHVLLDSKGPIVGGTSFLDFPGPTALEVRGDGRIKGRGAGATLQLHGVPLADRLSLSPYVRITGDESLGVGGGVGTGLRLEVTDGIGVDLSAGYHRNDMLQEVEGVGKDGSRAGFQFNAGIAGRF